MRKRFVLLLLVMGTLFLHLHCGTEPMLAGGTDTETGGTRVSGIMLQTDGTVARSAKVTVLPVDYDPLDAENSANGVQGLTDSNGRFTITVVDSGTYNVEAVHGVALTRLLIRNVRVAGDSVHVSTDTLRTPGTIAVAVPDSADTVKGYVFLQGTSRFARITRHGLVTIDSVPAGSVGALFYSIQNKPAAQAKLVDSLTVPPDSVVTIAYPGWQFSKKLFLNTSASGADIARTVINFPLAVRLTYDNFDFGQAAADGRDLRFANAKGTALPYEIELWDTVTKTALIWVLTDTILGNNSTQYITMSWGNPQAQSLSNGAAVFDTLKGWAGVWHLTEDAAGIQRDSLYKNSVEQANYGNDRVVSSGKTGIIDRGQGFNKGDEIRVVNVTPRLKPQTLTVSAWVKISSLDSLGSDAASMGDNYILRINKNGNPEFDFFSVPDSTMTISSDLIDCADSAWHYLAGTYDGSALRLYIDGVLLGLTPFSGPIPYNPGHNDFVIGSHFNRSDRELDGYIDEVECASAVRSPDWIRLCFMNQKQADVLVFFR